MKFESIKKETVMLNPQQDMKERRIPSEIRIDPLTGRSARICHFMELKWERPDFDAMVAGTEAYCPFCEDKVLDVTPCFPQEIYPQGRMRRDDMVLFPNLAPYDSIGAVATMGGQHYIPMAELSIERMASAFGFAHDFFRHIETLNHPEAVYHIINWNYMPPAGSSLIHPHLQVFSTSTAPNLMREELTAAKQYYENKKGNFWDDLVAAEMETGDRYLGAIGRSHWMTAYAPMGVAGDVLAVFEDVKCTLELTTSDLDDLATGLKQVLTGYEKTGIYSFNMNFFTGSRTDEYTRFHILFSPRTFFNQSLGTPDIGALRNLFNETLCMAFPEEINAMLKESF
jgi:galactose-1-phosphate uridylyltransferase